MGSLEKVESANRALVRLAESSDARQKLWCETKRNEILEALTSAANIVSDTYVQHLNPVENLESIAFRFRASPTPFIRSESIFVRSGGYLVFSQGVDGLIDVDMRRSYVEELEDRPKRVHVARIEPSQMSDVSVFNFVIRFLEHEVICEKSRIGFNIPLDDN